VAEADQQFQSDHKIDVDVDADEYDTPQDAAYHWSILNYASCLETVGSVANSLKPLYAHRDILRVLLHNPLGQLSASTAKAFQDQC
jgi:hypothetical protein